MQTTVAIEEKWLKSLKSDSTRKFYRLCLERFTKFARKTPQQLASLKSKKATQLVEAYLQDLNDKAVQTTGKPQEGQISVNSVAYYIAGVRSFFTECDDITINWKRINKSFPDKKKHTFRSYNLHEIRKLLSLADRREKVIILMMISSGIRVGAIAGLRFKDIRQKYSVIDSKGELREREFPDGIASIHVYADSEDDYYSFVTGECWAAIEEYRRYRHEQIGEKLTDKSFVIRDAYKNRPVLTGTIRKTIWELFTRCELPTEELQPDHACRHYFKTVTSNSKVIHEWGEAWLGHSQGLRDVYFDPKVEESWKSAIEQYQLALAGLTISEEARKMLSQEIQLKNVPEVERLQAEVEQLKSQRTGIVADVVEMIRLDRKAFNDIQAADDVNDALLAGIIQASGRAKTVEEIQSLLLKLAEARGIDRMKAGSGRFAKQS